MSTDLDLPTVCLEPLLSARDVAAYLGVPLSTLYDWRTHGKGPVAHRLGKHLKYAVSDVAVWLESQRDVPPVPHARQSGRHALLMDSPKHSLPASATRGDDQR